MELLPLLLLMMFSGNGLDSLRRTLDQADRMQKMFNQISTLSHLMPDLQQFSQGENTQNYRDTMQEIFSRINPK